MPFNKKRLLVISNTTRKNLQIISFALFSDVTSSYQRKRKESLCSLEISTFRKACFTSAKMTMKLNMNLTEISKILVNTFGREYKHLLNTALVFVLSLSSRITGLRGR